MTSKLIIQIEASSDSFGAYSTNIDGVYAAGDSIEDCMKNVENAVDIIRQGRKDYGDEFPEWMYEGDFEYEYTYDVQSILAYYAGIFTKPALERLTGINQKQLHHYASGLKKPRPAQRDKIQTALRAFGEELSRLSLV